MGRLLPGNVLKGNIRPGEANGETGIKYIVPKTLKAFLISHLDLPNLQTQ